MMVKKKKTIIEGMEVKQVFTSPFAFLYDFLGTAPGEPKPIRRFTEEHRTMVKKRVVSERATRWGAIQPIKEKTRR
jgi:hypothetical protein